MLSQAQLLDELMGRDRNLAPQDKKSSVHWSDPQVCKMYITGFCPHDLFTNTRSDLGFCEKLHDDKLRKEYNESARYGTMGYEDDFLRHLQNLLSDVDRRIRRGHSRLTTTAELMKERAPAKLDESDREKEAQLSEKVNNLVEQAEKLGCEGKVEEAQGVMKLVDQLKEERDMLGSKNRDPTFNGQEKQMEVCEVCGAFLIIGDAQIRVDDHLQGKQHKGYAQIKSTVEELKKRPWLERVRKQKEGDREKERGEENNKDGGGDRDRDRDRRRDRDRDSGGRRDRGRDYRDRDRRGDRDRDRRRDRSRERRRERSRSRERRRERSHSRERRRRDSSRSRSRERRHRDKDDNRPEQREQDERASSRDEGRKMEDQAERGSPQGSQDDKRSPNYSGVSSEQQARGSPGRD